MELYIWSQTIAQVLELWWRFLRSCQTPLKWKIICSFQFIFLYPVHKYWGLSFVFSSQIMLAWCKSSSWPATKMFCLPRSTKANVHDKSAKSISLVDAFQWYFWNVVYSKTCHIYVYIYGTILLLMEHLSRNDGDFFSKTVSSTYNSKSGLIFFNLILAVELWGGAGVCDGIFSDGIYYKTIKMSSKS